MARHCDVFMHGYLYFLLIFLPYFAVMPEKRGILLQYAVISYVPASFIMLGAAWQGYLKLNPPCNDAKYEAYATEFKTVFSQMATMDVKKMGKVLQQIPWADLNSLFIARGLLMDEIIVIPRVVAAMDSKRALQRLSSNVESCEMPRADFVIV